MKLHQITSVLEEVAPLNYQESYDNSGLIVGSPNDEVSKVLVCLDSLESVVEEAIEKNCQLIIAHHPIVFSGLKKLNGKNYIERTLIKAIKNDIAIYACHTNLDNVLHQGVNQKIANQLGLENVQVLSPKSGLMSKLVVYVPSSHANAVRDNLFENGAGNINDYSHCSFNSSGKGTFKAGNRAKPFVGQRGEIHTEEEIKVEVIILNQHKNNILQGLKEVHPYEEIAYDLLSIANENKEIGAGVIGQMKEEIETKDFLSLLKTNMKAACVRHTKQVKGKVKTIALCGGSGSFLLNDAIKQKADVFVTADYKYHQFFDAEDHLMIADIGHYESEQYTIELIQEILTSNLQQVEIIKTAINTNPVKYF